MIPNKLSDWTFEVIENIVSKGYFETISFDFKEKLPHSSDEKSKIRLIKSCCAFANQNGGFLIFGVKDDKGLSKDDRIIGIDANIDFPEHFGNYPKKGTPFIEWDFLNPGIDLVNGKKIHVVQIFETNIGPIGFESDDNWVFTKRTNKGNQQMTYDEIKNSYVNIYEKRIKLNLLVAELEHISETARSMMISDDKMNESYSLLQFNIEIIENVLIDTYTILAKDIEFLKIINKLRSTCKFVNNKIEIFWRTVVLPMTNIETIVKEHNEFVKGYLPSILQLSELAIVSLKNLKSKY